MGVGGTKLVLVTIDGVVERLRQIPGFSERNAVNWLICHKALSLEEKFRRVVLEGITDHCCDHLQDLGGLTMTVYEKCPACSR